MKNNSGRSDKVSITTVMPLKWAAVARYVSIAVSIKWTGLCTSARVRGTAHRGTPSEAGTASEARPLISFWHSGPFRL